MPAANTTVPFKKPGVKNRRRNSHASTAPSGSARPETRAASTPSRTAAGRVGEGHRHSQPLRDIVQCDGRRRAQTERRVRCPGEEGGYRLWEIVQQQRRGRGMVYLI